MPNLKHLQWGNETYDFDATAFNGKTYNQVKADIISKVDTAQFIVSTNAATTPNIAELRDYGQSPIKGELTPSDADKNNIYLVLQYDYYDEYISTIKDGKQAWVKLGTTDVNLHEYVKRGTYISEHAGGATVTGTAAVDYDKPNAKTASGSGSQNAITTYATPTATATFTGSSITFSPTATLNSYNPTLTVNKATASITFAIGSETGSDGSHSHTLSTHTHATQTVVNGITFTPSSLSTGTVQMLRSITPKTGSFLQGDVTGDTLILTGSSAVTSITEGYSTIISSITFTPSSLSSTTVNVAAVSSATTSRTSIASDHTHTLNSVVLNPVTGVSINKGTPSISVSSITYTPAGSISISMASHCHSYNAPASHQHDIVTTTATATGSATVTISSHVHDVVLE